MGDVIVDPRYRIVAFVGPSGCGKGRKIENLMARDNRFELVTSTTTRQARLTDLPGEYECVKWHVFKWRQLARQFLWTAKKHGNYYGTMASTLKGALSAPFPKFMHLEPYCVPRLIEVAGDAVCLFFLTVPPEQIIPRLRKRDPGREESYYQERYKTCVPWQSEAQRSGLPYIFVDNGDGKFDEADAHILQHLQQQPAQRSSLSMTLQSAHAS